MQAWSPSLQYQQKHIPSKVNALSCLIFSQYNNTNRNNFVQDKFGQPVLHICICTIYNILRKYLGLPLLSNTKFSKFKSPRFSSSCFLRNSNLGKTKLVCVAHLLEELKTSNSNSKLKRIKVANHLV